MQVTTLPKLTRLLPAALLAFGAALAPPEAAAEVQIRTLDDGTLHIFNETPVEKERRQSSRLLPVPKEELKLLIERYARFFGLSPQLVQAVVQAESGYNVKALSNKGAMGLMQLMPDTAALLGVTNAWDPQQNVRGGTAYLKQQLDRFGSVRLAVAAYNAGPNAVAKYSGVPPYRETQEYVERVLSLYQQSPPDALVDLVQDRARERREADRLHQELVVKQQVPAGNKVYLTRDANGYVMTDSPPQAALPKLTRRAALPRRAPAAGGAH
jgi:hypothetical protein